MTNNTEDNSVTQAHDKMLKKAFEYPEYLKGFFDQHLPEQIKHVILPGSIKITKETFIHENLRNSACDMLFSAQLKDKSDAYIYLLIEAQSSNDPFMAFRLLKYMTQICDRHLKNHPKQKNLPMVYPIVLWQGKGKYSAERNVWDLFNQPELARKTWFEDCQLLNVQEVPDDILTHNIWTGMQQLITKYIFNPAVLYQKIDQYGYLLKSLDQKDLGYEFYHNILHYVLTRIPESDRIILIKILDKHTNKGQQIMGSLADSFIQQGKAEGINLGIEKGVSMGIEKGVSMGIEKGIDLEKREIAKNLIRIGLSMQDISKATDLSIAEIQQLAKAL